jgi:hypothetical protein
MLAQLACVLVGLWLMAAPAILGYGDPARASDRVVGPFVAAVACIAIWAVVRDVRRVNLLAAAWLLVAPWVLGYGLVSAINSIVAGALLATLASRGGRVTQRFGGGWRALWPRRPEGAR